MKKSISLLIIIVLFLTAFNLEARSQSHTFENENIVATATVLSTLSIMKNEDVSFGNISATTTGEVFLDPQGNAHSYVGATATVGKFTITGDGNQIRVGWPESIILDDGATNEMTLTFSVSGFGTDTQSSSTDLTTENGFSIVTIETGAYYLWVGGSLGTLTNQTSGTYTGTADFTVEYN